MHSISATELVRNLSSAIDEVRITGHSLSVTKGNQVVATLAPPPKKGLTFSELSLFLKSLPSPGNDKDSMINDIDAARKQATVPDNPWE